MRKSLLACLMLIYCLITGSCSLRSEPKPEELSGALRIAIINAASYYESVGKVLPLHFPNIRFDVVTLDIASLKQMPDKIDEQKPDIVVIWHPYIYYKMIERGSLIDISPWIKRDKFDIENMHPSIVHFLKDIGGGGLYGLAPIFTSSAIYYNIDLFDRYGVPYPADQMSWEELNQLAARFPVEEGPNRIYGFNAFWNTYSGQISMLAQSEHLSYFDAAEEKLQMNTNPWRHLLQTIADMHKKGVIYKDGSDLFLAGKSAMTLQGPEYIALLKEKAPEMNWGIVTKPSYSQDRSINTSIVLNDIYAIHAKSANPDLAWEVVKFVNGKEMAQIQPRALSTRIAFSKQKNGVELEPFYKLGIDTFAFNEYLRNEPIPDTFTINLNKLIDREMDAAVKGAQSVENAIMKIQTEGQILLQSALAE